MPGHRQPLASPDGEVFSPRRRKDVLCSWHTVLYARPLFRKGRREYIYIIIQIFLSFFKKTVSKRRTLSELNWSLMCSKRPQRHFVNCFVRANLPHVWHSVLERATYGTEYACRAQKGFLWYATHLQRRAVPKAAPAAAAAASVRETAPAQR